MEKSQRYLKLKALGSAADALLGYKESRIEMLVDQAYEAGRTDGLREALEIVDNLKKT